MESVRFLTGGQSMLEKEREKKIQKKGAVPALTSADKNNLRKRRGSAFPVAQHGASLSFSLAPCSEFHSFDQVQRSVVRVLFALPVSISKSTLYNNTNSSSFMHSIIAT